MEFWEGVEYCVKVGAAGLKLGGGAGCGCWAVCVVVRVWVGESGGVGVLLGSSEPGVGLYGENGM